MMPAGCTSADQHAPGRLLADDRAAKVIGVCTRRPMAGKPVAGKPSPHQTRGGPRFTTDRHRHRDHKIKSRQAFGHAPRGITTRTAPAQVHVCGTTAA